MGLKYDGQTREQAPKYGGPASEPTPPQGQPEISFIIMMTTGLGAVRGKLCLYSGVGRRGILASSFWRVEAHWKVR